MSSSGRILKTAPICEAHLDLVRVKSGRVYKLRSPKLAYLASLSFYDSLNPTKNWGFPELTTKKESRTKFTQHVDPKPHVDNVGERSSSDKHKGGGAYRDRAAERRSLHGGFGVGPGQKKSGDDNDDLSSSPIFDTPEEATAKALNMSFGFGSYGTRILENMGWKEVNINTLSVRFFYLYLRMMYVCLNEKVQCYFNLFFSFLYLICIVRVY